MADRLTYKVPTAAEKQVLFKAGLGLKKIKFDIDDDEEAVMKKITSAESDSNEITSFPKANVGAQAKIYLMPIQRSLSTKPFAADKTSKVEEICLSCNKEFFVHSFVCTDMFETSEESDEEK